MRSLKGTATGQMALVVAALIVINLQLSTLAAGSTIHVASTEKIQQAIDKAADGDTIEIEAGTYSESLTITKRLILRSVPGAEDKPIIDASGAKCAILLNAARSEVHGLRVRNASGAGLMIKAGDSFVKGCAVEDCHDGIVIDSDRAVVSMNEISRNTEGIVVRYSSGCTIEGNEILENSIKEGADCGITLISSFDNKILSNNLTDNGLCGVAVRASSNNNISWNNVSGNRWYGIYLCDASSKNTIQGNNASMNRQAGIYIEGCQQTLVKGNTLIKNGRGLFLTDGASRNAVQENRINENTRGIELAFYSSENIIRGNTISRNQYGIRLSFSASRNSIVGNGLIGNTRNAYDLGADNRWDDGIEGNYYSDLGDAYNILGGDGVDRHPILTWSEN